MFSTKTTVLYLSPQKAYFYNGKEKSEIDWKGHGLSDVLKEFKEKTKNNSVRIILGNNLSYLPALFLPKSVKPEEIVSKANEIIPEEINNLNSVFDIKDEAGSDKSIVQIFAVAENLLTEIFKSSLENGINVECVCQILSVLAVSAEEKDKPSLFIWSGDEKVAFIAKDGVVYGSENIIENGREKIAELIDYVKNHFNIVPLILYSSEKEKDLLPSLKLETRNLTLDPFAIVASHSINEKNQGDFLFIKKHSEKEEKTEVATPVSEQKMSSSDHIDSVNKKDKSSVVPAIILFLVILSSIGFFVYQLLLKK